MKIVQVNAVYGFSSTGRNVAEMHGYFQQHGIESFVFTSDKEEQDEHIYRIGDKWDHKRHALFHGFGAYRAISPKVQLAR